MYIYVFIFICIYTYIYISFLYLYYVYIYRILHRYKCIFIVHLYLCKCIGFDPRHLSSCPIEFVTAEFVTRRVPNAKVKRSMKGESWTLVASLRPSL